MTDTSATEATLKENKAVIRRFVEEVQNGKSENAYWELNDPDFVNLAPLPPGVPSDREGGFAYLFERAEEQVPEGRFRDARFDHSVARPFVPRAGCRRSTIAPSGKRTVCSASAMVTAEVPRVRACAYATPNTAPSPRAS